MDVDPAQDRDEPVPLALGRELHVRFGNLAEVVRKSRQLALRVLPQVRSEEFSPVVQDDLHKPSIRLVPSPLGERVGSEPLNWHPRESLRVVRVATYFVEGLYPAGGGNRVRISFGSGMPCEKMRS